MADRTDRPVLSGVLALLAVALGVGLILGLGALVVTRMAGIGGGDGDAADGDGASMYLPAPEKTDSPQASRSGDGGKKGDEPSGEESEEAQPTIVLNAGQDAVAPMQQIDLSGNYPGGDGAILRVQRFESGKWIDFPVTASVSNGSFTTYVQTGQGGVNKFRMFDADAGDASNAVKVRVG